MPKDNETQQAIDVLEAKKALEVLAEQKDTVIKEFNQRYKDLDEKVKILDGRKKDLDNSVLSITSANEEAEAIVSKAKREATEIVNSAKASAVEIIDKAKIDAEVILLDAKEKNNEASRVLDLSAKRDTEANSLKIHAEKLIKDAQTVTQKAKDIEAESIRMLADAIEKRKALAGEVAKIEKVQEDIVSRETRISTQERAAADQLTKNSIERQDLIDERAKLGETVEAFNAYMADKRAQISKELGEIAVLKESLIRQKDENSFKNAELDAGFSRLTREQEEVKRQKAVVDAMKKELSK